MNIFQQWVEKYGGLEYVAIDLGVSSFTVRIWLQQKGTPSVKNIIKLIELANGDLTMDDVIRSCTPLQIKKTGKAKTPRRGKA